MPDDEAHARPRLLCVMQLPPPVHGVTVVNQIVARSQVLSSALDLEVLPLASAGTFEDLDRVSLRKVARVIETAVRLATALVRRRPRAVYFTLTPTGAAFYRDCLFIAIMRVAAVPRIYHLHGGTARVRSAARWRRALYRWAFEDAWVIHLAARLAAELGDVVPRDRLLVVPNGVAVRATRTRTRQPGIPRLLYFSNLTETKGPLVLIEALGLMRARGIAFDATFAGAVHDPAFLARCHTALRRHRLEPHVRYIGPAYGDDKARLFEEHDVFVLPTCNDAFPLVALEAMQAGLPIVTTRVGALPDIVVDGETGLLVPPGDPRALADRLALLIDDVDLQRRMGARGRARCLQEYTAATFERNLATALIACLGTPGGSR